MKKIFSFPFHPLFFATYFFLHLHATNIHQQLSFSALLFPYSIALGLTVIVCVGLRFAFKNFHAASFLTSILVFLFFSFGHVHNVIKNIFPLPQEVLLLLFAAILGVSILTTIKKKESLDRVTPQINIMALILFLMPLVQTISYKVKHGGESTTIPTAQTQAKPDRKVASDIQHPDIYYIVLDEYAHHIVLRDIFKYDNTPFLNELKKRGFYIAEQSHTNYIRTVLSLPSSLNMQYLDFLTERLGPKSTDTSLPFNMVRANNVTVKLKSIGYEYALVHSGASPTDVSPLADYHIEYGIVDELAAVMAKGTLLKKAAAEFMHEQARKRHFFNLSEVKKIADNPNATFTLAHLMLPHPPFVFDRDGNPTDTEAYSLTNDDYGDSYNALYLEQLIYTNKLVLDLVDTLIKNSRRPPVIILQSDHGNTPPGDWNDGANFLTQRARILNAYYITDDAKASLYPDISPVNTFRVIFNAYFGTKFQLLEDKIYYSHPEKSPYVFKDVTKFVLENEAK